MWVLVLGRAVGRSLGIGELFFLSFGLDAVEGKFIKVGRPG